jgi:hypothetical protein
VRLGDNVLSASEWNFRWWTVSQEMHFPFCLCWANETWSGVWHGVPRRILIEQT